LCQWSTSCGRPARLAPLLSSRVYGSRAVQTKSIQAVQLLVDHATAPLVLTPHSHGALAVAARDGSARRVQSSGEEAAPSRCQTRAAKILHPPLLASTLHRQLHLRLQSQPPLQLPMGQVRAWPKQMLRELGRAYCCCRWPRWRCPARSRPRHLTTSRRGQGCRCQCERWRGGHSGWSHRCGGHDGGSC
jgi:hypothetical protein